MTHLSFILLNIEGHSASSIQQSFECLLTDYINCAHYLQTVVLVFIQCRHRRPVLPRWETPKTKTHSTTTLGFLQEATFVLLSTTLHVAFFCLLSIPMGKHLFLLLLLRAPLCSR